MDDSDDDDDDDGDDGNDDWGGGGFELGHFIQNEGFTVLGYLNVILLFSLFSLMLTFFRLEFPFMFKLSFSFIGS